jgi:hypothetical protein
MTLTHHHQLPVFFCTSNFQTPCIHKLAGTSWGANAHTLRVTGLALVYSTAEYCCPVWKNSAHVNKMDAQLNTTLRIITGTLKSTPTPWLHVLAHIIPYDIRRNYVTKRFQITGKE